MRGRVELNPIYLSTVLLSGAQPPAAAKLFHAVIRHGLWRPQRL